MTAVSTLARAWCSTSTGRPRRSCSTTARASASRSCPPDRSRVIYPAEPLDGLDDPDGAIRARARSTRSTPIRCPRCSTPGMKLTIAFDDISLPLPPMRRPDIRQRIIEAVLDLAAEAGVDDVHLIAALALHRRMTEDELRHAVGDRVYDAFAPQGALYNHDAEDPDDMVLLGTTTHGEEVQINKRAAESDLIVYVNINLVAMDGGWKSTATGLSGYRRSRHHHNVAHHAAARVASWTGTTPSCTTATGAGRGHHATPASRSSRSRRRSTTTPSATTARCRCCRSASGSGRPRTGPRSSACKAGLERMPPQAAPQDLPGLAGALRAHLGAGRRGRGRARDDHRSTSTTSTSCRSRARPTSSRWGCRTSAPTT